MEVPQPTAGHRQLERLVGTWEGEETMHSSQWDPIGGTASGISRVRTALGGFVAIVDYEQRSDGQVTFTVHGVYSYNPDSEQIVLHWFDCMGSPPEVFCGGFDGDVLTITSHNRMGYARLSYDPSEPGALRSRMAMSPDGERWATLFEGRYRRTD